MLLPATRGDAFSLRVRWLIALAAAGCSAPCEPLALERAYRPTDESPLEILISVDGSPSFADERAALEEAWASVLDSALLQDDDGQAAYLHERVRVRFIAASTGCDPPVCDGRSTAEWVRLSLERDDDAFRQQGVCLFRSVPACTSREPLDALVAALEAEPPVAGAHLKVVIVSEADDASGADPAAVASGLAELATNARTLTAGVVAGPPVGADASCAVNAIDADALPRLSSYVEALDPSFAVELAPACGVTIAAHALGGDDGLLALYLARASPPLSAGEAGLVDCVVEETLALDGLVTSCAQMSHLGRTFHSLDSEGREVCDVMQEPGRERPGWYFDRDLSEVRFVAGAEPAPSAEVHLRCDARARVCERDLDCSTPRSLRAKCDAVEHVCVGACVDDADCWPGEACTTLADGDWCTPISSCE